MGGGEFSGPSRNGSRRHIGNIREVGSCSLDSIHLASRRFSLARSRGLPAKGIIQLLRKRPRKMAACLSVAQTSPFSRWIAHTGIGRKVPVPAIALPESWTVDIGLTRVDHVRL